MSSKFVKDQVLLLNSGEKGEVVMKNIRKHYKTCKSFEKNVSKYIGINGPYKGINYHSHPHVSNEVVFGSRMWIIRRPKSKIEHNGALMTDHEQQYLFDSFDPINQSAKKATKQLVNELTNQLVNAEQFGFYSREGVYLYEILH